MSNIVNIYVELCIVYSVAARLSAQLTIFNCIKTAVSHDNTISQTGQDIRNPNLWGPQAYAQIDQHIFQDNHTR